MIRVKNKPPRTVNVDQLMCSLLLHLSGVYLVYWDKLVLSTKILKWNTENSVGTYLYTFKFSVVYNLKNMPPVFYWGWVSRGLSEASGTHQLKMTWGNKELNLKNRDFKNESKLSEPYFPKKREMVAVHTLFQPTLHTAHLKPNWCIHHKVTNNNY